MRESGDPELIFFNVEGGSFISASDALRECFDGLVQGEETVLHGCSSTISLRVEVSIAYSPSDAFEGFNICVVAGLRTLDRSGNTAGNFFLDTVTYACTDTNFRLARATQ